MIAAILHWQAAASNENNNSNNNNNNRGHGDVRSWLAGLTSLIAVVV
jgi:hypothetical protein